MTARIALLVLAAALLAPLPVRAQDFPTADVSVLSVRAAVGATIYACRVDVDSEGNAAALNTRLTILLPPAVTLRNVSLPGCLGSAPVNGFNSSVDCALGDLRVGEMRFVSLLGDLAPGAPAASRSCTAFVSSDTPDGHRANNFGQSVEP